ncbi:hypothetical protein BJY21_001690 [Kineosphaera limosa]|uniref:Uncharacterized protein n=1 Tax=Kineosphaera limosa NBRC 100340 TaxID=1184609 RepID=K6VFQ8_9MICO|nr:hypothetical protein [Kineosphaera limosa]NYE00506.1 hypothetical protein [Kineosphaera limosa]GAB95028.1 hypothetical protein KILIM_015_00900 [Kineosphaera limosa NBRC 100340]
MSARESGGITSSRGAQITGLLAVIYGLGFAFLPEDSSIMQIWLVVGAVIVGVLFVVYLLIPFLRSLGARR